MSSPLDMRTMNNGGVVEAVNLSLIHIYGESRTGAVNINPRCGVETEHGRSIWTESVKHAILSQK